MAPADVALIRRRQARLAVIRTSTGAAVGRVFSRLPGYTPDQEARFVAAAEPIVKAGQTRAASLQIAYLQRALGEPVDFDLAVVLERAAVDLRSPFAALGNALGGDVDFADAVAAGLARAVGIGESGVQWASRAANETLNGHDRISGWTRTLTGSACDWCVEVSAQTYRSADSASFGHLACDCGVDPIVDGADTGSVLNDEVRAELDSAPEDATS